MAEQISCFFIFTVIPNFLKDFCQDNTANTDIIPPFNKMLNYKDLRPGICRKKSIHTVVSTSTIMKDAFFSRP